MLGGPLHRVGQRLGFVRDKSNGVRFGFVLGWFSWLILISLAQWEGVGQKLFSLALVAAHVRLLVVIPLFFLCETAVDAKLREFVQLLVRSEVAPPAMLPALESEIARVQRWSNSWIPDAMALLAAAMLTLLSTELHISGRSASFDSGHTIATTPLAGLWYWGFCLPFFRFLVFRWVWRLALWWRFLWRLSKMDLRLFPTHPDGAGGLGYLEVAQMHFATLAFAVSIVVSASFAEEISSGKAVFEVIYPALVVTLLVEFVLFLVPPCFFAVKLRSAQEKGLSDYSEFAAHYVGAFEAKWLSCKTNPDEALLGTPDIQSLADLSNSVSIARSMRWAPMSTRLFVTISVATLAPMAPLFLFKYPVADLAQMLFKKLAGL